MNLTDAKYMQHYKSLLSVGLPIMIGQLGVIILGFADTMMVGHHSTADLGAASFVNNIMNMVIIFGTGFSYGLTPVVGALFGTGHKAEAGQALRCSLLSNAVVAVMMSALMLVVYFNVHRMGQPAELLPLIRPYFLVLIVSLLFVMLFNAFKQFADGITDTRVSMWILLGGNVLTISQFTFMIYYGLGAAVAIRVSSFHGQSDRDGVRLTVSAGFRLMLALEIVLSGIVFCLRHQLGGWFTDSLEVASSVVSLMLPFLIYQFGDGLQILFANALRGTSDVKSLMVIAFIAYFVVSLPVGYFCGFVLGMRLVGIWMAFPFGLTAAGVMMWLRFRRSYSSSGS